ncbi:glycosyltransferase [Rhodopirellula sp. MGV]|uniref:glycosyltransferase n=1 Tax=Rhodopirellula sp. MGV TaxID=2023130 RepID=UPI000B969CDA|nr:glycosyltransferase [Rhodopirellula sp. MGV]OYP37475.1 hypothetical protein CGZ80_04925 [Rhodopirellula sp. MGV]PNY37877.1 hypothetical protein C2E31_05060 [Rhodopirellula baltica]
MSSSRPRVSVLMPIWNTRHDYVFEAVESLARQTIRDWELVVVEDPSEQNARELIRTFADPRIRYVGNESRTSLVSQLNRGLDLCQAAYVARLDADDRCQPQRLEQQLAYLDGHAKCGVVGCQLEIIDEAGDVVAQRPYPVGAARIVQTMRLRNAIAHPGAMFRKSLVESLGGYRDAFPYAEDYDLWSRVHKAGVELHNVPETLLQYRVHNGQIKSQKLRAQIAGTIGVKRAYWKDSMGPKGRLRLAGEQVLMAFPPRLITRLFRFLYHNNH